jgi:hypothetical protein
MLALNLLPVVSAGIISALIGFVWYHPRVFGSAWMRLAGITPETVEQGKRRMHVYATLALLASMLAAYVIRALEVTIGISDVVGAAQLGLLLWTGFVVPVLSGIVLWEQKSVLLYAINAGYWLVSFIAMAVVVFF